MKIESNMNTRIKDCIYDKLKDVLKKKKRRKTTNIDALNWTSNIERVKAKVEGNRREMKLNTTK